MNNSIETTCEKPTAGCNPKCYEASAMVTAIKY